MDDRAVCQWVIEQRERLKTFMDAVAWDAKPTRAEVFLKLLAVNNEMVGLFWEINIARDKEHLERIAEPEGIYDVLIAKDKEMK